MQYTAFDAHKHYTWARVERPDGTVVREKKILHEPGALRQFLAGCEPGSPVAVETVGNWYWIVDEVEAANVICRHRGTHRQRHTTQLYERIARRRGHQKAIGAVARHLAEAAYWMLTKGEPYREPGSSTGA